MLRFIIPFILLFLLEFYAFFALKTVTKNKFVLIAYWVAFVVVLGIVYYQFNLVQKQSRFNLNTGYAIALMLTYFVPKIFVFLVLFGEDVFRFFATLANYFSLDTSVKDAIPSRRAFVSKIALGLAAIPFAGFLYGVFKGKYDFRVITQHIEFDDLPDEFDGYRITQISDVHSGSFDNIDKIEYAINLINEQESDVILFTGDMVNAKAEEMDPYVKIFSKLKAKDGKFSVLGNHDYGYYAYDSVADFDSNHKKIEAVHKAIGFDLLQNENRTISRAEAKLNILGVENWGASRHFPKRGSLEKVTENLPNNAFNILMSHDPSHFDYKEKEFNSKRDRFKLDTVKDETNIIDFHKKIQLTLAGHTHGMQFGIEIPFLNFKWSPVKYRYPKWAGLYEEAGKYLYVNRGFGFLAFPGRVGIWPEITVLELKKRNKLA